MTITLVPDADLSQRFIQEAWPHRDVLLRAARRLTHNDADADDLLQDTMLNAYRGFDRFTEGTNLKAWLFRILQNQWINNFRWKQRRPEEMLSGEITDRDLADSAAHAAVLKSAESELVDALPDNDIRAAMLSLSEGFRMVVYYADIEGYTYAETAVLMGIPIGTVMSRVSRARRQLRIALADKACAFTATDPQLAA